MSYILTFDQGTSSSRAILFNQSAQVLAIAQQEFAQIYPDKTFVEQDPEEIYQTQIQVGREVLLKSGIDASEVRALGITNQRETTVVWDKNTGEPVYNAIVWQDKRTLLTCQNLAGHYGLMVQQKTGLVIDPYFSATKIAWILDHVPGARQRAEKGELLFGTIDSWLLWRLTRGRLHLTDVSNASRTLLFNIHTLSWDEELLRLFRIPASMLPEVRSSSEIYGHTADEIFGKPLPIGALAGDQQAALFGQRAFESGKVKATFGTGCFILMNTGTKPHLSRHKLLTTIAWQIDDTTSYALEGNIFIAGAMVKWLRDKLGLIQKAADSESLALSVKSPKGVFVIPALAGLGAPYWDAEVHGTITGLTLDTGKAHIVRAALESIAFRVKDLIKLIQRDSGLQVSDLLVDGGASANNFLMQFLSDLLSTPVHRPPVTETTALGAAFLAGLSSGFWSLDDIKNIHPPERSFTPGQNAVKALKRYKKWRRLVKALR